MYDFTELLMVLEKVFLPIGDRKAHMDNDVIIKELFEKQGEQSVINFIKKLQEGSLNIKELLRE